MKSEYLVLLPDDICCSLQSFSAIALKTKKRMTKTSSQLKAPVLITNFETSDVLSAVIAGRDGVVPNELNTSRDYIKSGKLKSNYS